MHTPDRLESLEKTVDALSKTVTASFQDIQAALNLILSRIDLESRLAQHIGPEKEVDLGHDSKVSVSGFVDAGVRVGRQSPAQQSPKTKSRREESEAFLFEADARLCYNGSDGELVIASETFVSEPSSSLLHTKTPEAVTDIPSMSDVQLSSPLSDLSIRLTHTPRPSEALSVNLDSLRAASEVQHPISDQRHNVTVGPAATEHAEEGHEDQRHNTDAAPHLRTIVPSTIGPLTTRQAAKRKANDDASLLRAKRSRTLPYAYVLVDRPGPFRSKSGGPRIAAVNQFPHPQITTTHQEDDFNMTQQEGRVEVSMRTDSEEAEVNIDVAFGLDSMPELTDSDIEPDVVEGQAGVRADGPSVERSSGVHRDALLTPRQNFDFMQENTPPEMSITVELRPSVSGAVDERSSELATHNSTGEVESPRENPKLAEHSSLNASNIIDATRPSAGLALVTPTMHQELRDTTPIAGPSGYVTSSEHPFVQEPQVQAQALSGLEQTALTPNNDHTAHLTTSSGAQETNDNVSCRGTIQIPNSTPNSLSERCAALSGTNNAADEEQKLELVRPKGRSRKSADSRSATGTPDINMRWMSADLPESPAMNYYHSPPPSADAGTSSLTISVAGSSGILMNGAVAPSVCDRQGKPHAYVTQAGSCQVNPPNTSLAPSRYIPGQWGHPPSAMNLRMNQPAGPGPYTQGWKPLEPLDSGSVKLLVGLPDLIQRKRSASSASSASAADIHNMPSVIPRVVPTLSAHASPIATSMAGSSTPWPGVTPSVQISLLSSPTVGPSTGPWMTRTISAQVQAEPVARDSGFDQSHQAQLPDNSHGNTRPQGDYPFIVPNGVLERLTFVPTFPVTLDPAIRSVTVDRAYMRAHFHCSTRSLYTSEEFVFPNPQMNPEVPRVPGHPGLFCRAVNFVPWENKLVKVLVKQATYKWLYLGNYQSARVRSLSRSEFSELPPMIQNSWATYILSMKDRPYVELRARISLRQQHGREVSQEELNSVLATSKTFDDLRPEVILEAYRSGHHMLHVWKLWCVSYDEAFQRQLAQEFPVWVKPPSKKRNASTMPAPILTHRGVGGVEENSPETSPRDIRDDLFPTGLSSPSIGQHPVQSTESSLPAWTHKPAAERSSSVRDRREGPPNFRRDVDWSTGWHRRSRSVSQERQINEHEDEEEQEQEHEEERVSHSDANAENSSLVATQAPYFPHSLPDMPVSFPTIRPPNPPRSRTIIGSPSSQQSTQAHTIPQCEPHRMQPPLPSSSYTYHQERCSEYNGRKSGEQARDRVGPARNIPSPRVLAATSSSVEHSQERYPQSHDARILPSYPYDYELWIDAQSPISQSDWDAEDMSSPSPSASVSPLTPPRELASVEGSPKRSRARTVLEDKIRKMQHPGLPPPSYMHDYKQRLAYDSDTNARRVSGEKGKEQEKRVSQAGGEAEDRRAPSQITIRFNPRSRAEVGDCAQPKGPKPLQGDFHPHPSSGQAFSTVQPLRPPGPGSKSTNPSPKVDRPRVQHPRPPPPSYKYNHERYPAYNANAQRIGLEHVRYTLEPEDSSGKRMSYYRPRTHHYPAKDSDPGYWPAPEA